MIEGNIGILHPGEMGVTLAMAAQNSGMPVYWVSEGRSQETSARAEQIKLNDASSLENLCGICSTMICVCPPSAALDVAEQVASLCYSGLYIDANAISPQSSQEIGQVLQAAGISYVDGSIIGPPAWKENTTRLYLSGEQAGVAASCFAEGPLAVNVIGDEIGQASALKMCYAAYTKGTSALLCAILAAGAPAHYYAPFLQQPKPSMCARSFPPSGPCLDPNWMRKRPAVYSGCLRKPGASRGRWSKLQRHLIQ